MNGESISFELSREDWHLDDVELKIDFGANVSKLLKEPEHEKTVMFITHISLDSEALVEAWIKEVEFNVWKWMYVFPR